MTIHPQIGTHTGKYQKWAKKKSELLEEIEQTENKLKEIKISEFLGTTSPLWLSKSHKGLSFCREAIQAGHKKHGYTKFWGVLTTWATISGLCRENKAGVV